jgi:hypothetical protein
MQEHPREPKLQVLTPSVEESGSKFGEGGFGRKLGYCRAERSLWVAPYERENCRSKTVETYRNGEAKRVVELFERGVTFQCMERRSLGRLLLGLQGSVGVVHTSFVVITQSYTSKRSQSPAQEVALNVGHTNIGPSPDILHRIPLLQGCLGDLVSGHGRPPRYRRILRKAAQPCVISEEDIDICAEGRFGDVGASSVGRPGFGVELGLRSTLSVPLFALHPHRTRGCSQFSLRSHRLHKAHRIALLLPRCRYPRPSVYRAEAALASQRCLQTGVEFQQLHVPSSLLPSVLRQLIITPEVHWSK